MNEVPEVIGEPTARTTFVHATRRRWRCLYGTRIVAIEGYGPRGGAVIGALADQPIPTQALPRADPKDGRPRLSKTLQQGHA